jgi:hypothetical protein
MLYYLLTCSTELLTFRLTFKFLATSLDQTLEHRLSFRHFGKETVMRLLVKHVSS